MNPPSKLHLPSHYSSPKTSLSYTHRPSHTSHPPSHTHRSLPKTNPPPPQPEKPLDFYFDSKARKKIIIKTINTYMQQGKNPEDDKLIFSHKNMQKRLSKTSQNPRKKRSIEVTPRLGATLGTIQFNKIESIVSEHYAQTLPIISQIQEKPFRPFSENKQRRNELSESRYVSGRESLINSSLDLENNETIAQEEKRVETPLYKCEFYSVAKVRERKSLKKTKKFSFEGRNLLQLQKKVRQMGIPVLWEKTIFSQTLVYPKIKSLREQISSSASFQNGKEKIYKIFPHLFYFELFSNQNEWLLDIVSGLCKQLVKGEGKVMNNKINLSNVFKIDEKQIMLQDWTSSSLKEIIKVTGGDKPLIKYSKPTLKDKSGWLSNPYYLAPQILKLQSCQDAQYEELWKENPTASDIWSLGCMILQILTLIPLNLCCRSSVKGRQVFRKGLLAMQKFSIEQLLRKQKYLCSHYEKHIERECRDLKVEGRVYRILKGALRMRKEERMSAGEVLRIIQNKE